MGPSTNLVAGVQNSLNITLTSLATPPYSFELGTLASEMVEYGNGSDWVANFSQPVSNLLVYAKSWRTTNAVSGTGITSYEFDRPFSIAPGSTGGNFLLGNGLTPLANDTLVLNGAPSDFFEGILIFPGPISSLSLDSSEAIPGKAVAVTFGVAVVPEPGSLSLLAMTSLALLIRRKHPFGKV